MDSSGKPGTGELGGKPKVPVVTVQVVDVRVVGTVSVDVVCVKTVEVATVLIAVTGWVVVEKAVTGTVVVVIAAPGPNRKIKPFWPTAQPSVEATIQTSFSHRLTRGTE
jgi:hypothetical protein